MLQLHLYDQINCPKAHRVFNSNSSISFPFHIICRKYKEFSLRYGSFGRRGMITGSTTNNGRFSNYYTQFKQTFNSAMKIQIK